MIIFNGHPRAHPNTLGELLEQLGLGAHARGVAVAVDGEVVPRSMWGARALTDGARVEVVGAIQGG